MHRFFLTEIDIDVNRPVDLSPLAHQLHRVLRLSAGEFITILDNEGNEYVVRLLDLHARGAHGEVLSIHRNVAEPPLPIVLYQCSLKADKFEWVLQKGTELGVSCFVPIISARSIVRPAAALRKKYDRWQAIIREAAEQCGRGRLPLLQEPLSWSAAVASATGLRLLFWEEETYGAPSITTFVESQLNLSLQRAPKISLIVGPEGGIAPEEAEQAQTFGWQFVSLGPRILRAETAALAAATLIVATLENK